MNEYNMFKDQKKDPEAQKNFMNFSPMSRFSSVIKSYKTPGLLSPEMVKQAGEQKEIQSNSYNCRDL